MVMRYERETVPAAFPLFFFPLSPFSFPLFWREGSRRLGRPGITHGRIEVFFENLATVASAAGWKINECTHSGNATGGMNYHSNFLSYLVITNATRGNRPSKSPPYKA